MKRKISALLCLMGFVLTGCGGPGSANREPLRLAVDPAKASRVNGGVFEGWGTSLCWWANRIGYSDALSRRAAEAFCDPEKGLGLNILRYNIGGGDDPAHDHITRTDSMMPGFWADPRVDGGGYAWDYDWRQDQNQRNVLQKCLEAGGEGMLVEAFSNSPPYFMTASGCSSGSVNPFDDNLKPDAYEAFARYLADVVEHFDREWGVRFQSIDPMNEPDTAFWTAMSWKQEGCHFDSGASQSRVLVALAAALREKGLEDIVISGTDETSIDSQILSLNRLSEEAAAVLGRVDTHTYAGSSRKKLRELALSMGKNLWMSEVDGGETLGENAGEMGAALWLANRIAEDINGLTPSAWILWQVIDSHISFDGWLGRKDSGMVDVKNGYWGTAVAHHDRQELILTMKYYALGQFTRYIRPGSRLIEMSGPAVAALDERKNTLTAVVVNAEGRARDVALDISGFPAFADGAPVRVIRTSGGMAKGEHWAELPQTAVAEGTVAATLAPYSITTFMVGER